MYWRASCTIASPTWGWLANTSRHQPAMLSSKPKPRPTAKMTANTGMMAIIVLNVSWAANSQWRFTKSSL